MTLARMVRPLRWAVPPAFMVAALALRSPAPAAPSPGGADAWQDPRLEKKVTLHLKRTPLSGVLKELAKQTGATLDARSDLADEPAIVYATDQPAAEVMRQLAGMFGYRWMKTGAVGKPRYELFQDSQARAAEEALRHADVLQAVRRGEERRRAGPAPGQREREPDLVQEPARGLIALLTTADWQALISGKTLRYSPQAGSGARPLPSVLAGKFAASVSGKGGSLIRRTEAAKPASAPAAPNGPQLVRVAVWMEHSVSPRGSLWVRLQVQPSLIESHPAGLLRRQAFSDLGGTLPYPTPPQFDPAEAGRRWTADALLGRTAAFPTPPATPASHRRTNYGPKGPRLCDLLPLVAEAYRCNLVADAYQTQPALQQPPREGETLPLYNALNAVAFPLATWTRQGAFIRVRSRAWYWERLSDVPDRVLQHWIAQLRDRRRLDLDDAATLTLSLRDEQALRFPLLLADAGLFLEPAMFLSGGIEMGHRELLRAYGSLTPAQRQALRTGGTLSTDRLPPTAGDWLGRALDRIERGPFEALDQPEWRGGDLSLRVDELDRTVGGDDDSDLPREAIPYRASSLRPRSGPQAGRSTLRENVDRPDAPPGFAQGGQAIQSPVFTFRSRGGAQAGCRVYLPWVYLAEPTPSTLPAESR